MSNRSSHSTSLAHKKASPPKPAGRLFCAPVSNAMKLGFSDAIGKYADHLRGLRKSTRTVNKKVAELKRFARWLAGRLERQVSVCDLAMNCQDYIVEYLNQGVSAVQAKSVHLPSTSTARQEFTRSLVELLKWVKNNSSSSSGKPAEFASFQLVINSMEQYKEYAASDKQEQTCNNKRTLEQYKEAKEWIDYRDLKKKVIHNPAIEAEFDGSVEYIRRVDFSMPISNQTNKELVGHLGLVSEILVGTFLINSKAGRPQALMKMRCGDISILITTSMYTTKAFKNHKHFCSDTYYIGGLTKKIVIAYRDVVRPVILRINGLEPNEAPDEFFISDNAKPYTQLTYQLTAFTQRYCDVSINPTRLRQIIETHAHEQRSEFVQSNVALALTHGPRVVKDHYIKSNMDLAVLRSQLSIVHDVADSELKNKTPEELLAVLDQLNNDSHLRNTDAGSSNASTSSSNSSASSTSSKRGPRRSWEVERVSGKRQRGVGISLLILAHI